MGHLTGKEHKSKKKNKKKQTTERGKKNRKKRTRLFHQPSKAGPRQEEKPHNKGETMFDRSDKLKGRIEKMEWAAENMKYREASSIDSRTIMPNMGNKKRKRGKLNPLKLTGSHWTNGMLKKGEREQFKRR